jgi:hypothetical protein
MRATAISPQKRVSPSTAFCGLCAQFQLTFRQEPVAQSPQQRPVSTTGATSFRAAFFTGARLGLALATIRFAFPRADLTALRALLRLAELRPRSLARIFNFDPFLRLAMIAPRSGWCSQIHSVGSKANGQLGKRQIASYQQIAAHLQA